MKVLLEDSYVAEVVNWVFSSIMQSDSSSHFIEPYVVSFSIIISMPRYPKLCIKSLFLQQTYKYANFSTLHSCFLPDPPHHLYITHPNFICIRDWILRPYVLFLTFQSSSDVSSCGPSFCQRSDLALAVLKMNYQSPNITSTTSKFIPAPLIPGVTSEAVSLSTHILGSLSICHEEPL